MPVMMKSLEKWYKNKKMLPTLTKKTHQTQVVSIHISPPPSHTHWQDWQDEILHYLAQCLPNYVEFWPFIVWKIATFLIKYGVSQNIQASKYRFHSPTTHRHWSGSKIWNKIVKNMINLESKHSGCFLSNTGVRFFNFFNRKVPRNPYTKSTWMNVYNKKSGL